MIAFYIVVRSKTYENTQCGKSKHLLEEFLQESMLVHSTNHLSVKKLISRKFCWKIHNFYTVTTVASYRRGIAMTSFFCWPSFLRKRPTTFKFRLSVVRRIVVPWCLKVRDSSSVGRRFLYKIFVQKIKAKPKSGLMRKKQKLQTNYEKGFFCSSYSVLGVAILYLLWFLINV